MVTKEIIKIENLWYTYSNGYTALKGINLKIYRREFIAIVGANGSGKTTLIKHLNGLLKPSKGRVIVFGMDTRTTSVARLARHVGVVFQNPLNQFFEETVEKEVAFALKNFGKKSDSNKISDILKNLGIEHLRYNSPFEASLGEQRRIALASVLIYEPDVIVLDEPTAGLDYKAKINLLKILKELLAKDKTVLVVSHDIEFLAKAPLTRIIVLNSGNLVFDGLPIEAFYNIPLMYSSKLIPPQIPALIIGLNLQKYATPLNEEEAYETFRFLIKKVLIDGHR
ncbi:MAG: ABC transporter ATP-binding protein [Thermoprotei archaeon]|nr:MAG: ABC transporter ATP-binding protein [Thermoprotei archaeon]